MVKLLVYGKRGTEKGKVKVKLKGMQGKVRGDHEVL